MTFKELRERAGFASQESLAAAIDRKQTTISAIERGRTPDPRYTTVEKIARALNTTPAVVMRAIAESCGQA